jgi:hypothetical protein
MMRCCFYKLSFPTGEIRGKGDRAAVEKRKAELSIKRMKLLRNAAQATSTYDCMSRNMGQPGGEETRGLSVWMHESCADKVLLEHHGFQGN